MKIVVHDAEIKNAIPPKLDSLREKNVEYCKGWGDHAGMGIATVCALDVREGRMRVFCDDNLDALQALLLEGDILVGFNNINFDDKLYVANGIAVPTNKTYDLLVEIRKACGVSKFDKGFKLDQICDANGLPRKTDDGAFAPILWQQGKIGRVIDYCINDVLMTYALLKIIIKNGSIKHPVTGSDVIIDNSRFVRS